MKILSDEELGGECSRRRAARGPGEERSHYDAPEVGGWEDELREEGRDGSEKVPWSRCSTKGLGLTLRRDVE